MTITGPLYDPRAALANEGQLGFRHFGSRSSSAFGYAKQAPATSGHGTLLRKRVDAAAFRNDIGS
jgi:hypothetical protein